MKYMFSLKETLEIILVCVLVYGAGLLVVCMLP